jgi:Cu(I)/Ag(I) efflux system periplasmic protein CusF
MQIRRFFAPVLAVLSIALPLPALAQSSHMNHGQASAPAPAAAWTDGIVRTIHKKEGQVTISHEQLVNLGMGKMTMTFRLKTPALVDGIKEGSKIRFVAENVKGELTVVALEAVR